MRCALPVNARENAGVVINLATGVMGRAAAGDTFDSIEGFYGTDFADIMTGAGGDDYFLGADGDDTLCGGGGSDVLIGGGGADTLNGGAGDDFLYPGSDTDADTIIGGPAMTGSTISTP